MSLSCGQRWPDEDAALHSKRFLAGGYEIAPCLHGQAGVHLARIVSTVRTAKPAARRETGPSRSVRALVLDRDGWQCARCGKACGPGVAPYSLQHRLARGSGGTSDPAANSPARLLLLCGTATTGCHGEVESRRYPEDHDKGYRLERGQDPEAEPVMYFEPSGSGFTAWLLPDGSLSFDGPGQVAS